MVSNERQHSLVCTVSCRCGDVVMRRLGVVDWWCDLLQCCNGDVVHCSSGVMFMHIAL